MRQARRSHVRLAMFLASNVAKNSHPLVNKHEKCRKAGGTELYGMVVTLTIEMALLHFSLLNGFISTPDTIFHLNTFWYINHDRQFAVIT